MGHELPDEIIVPQEEVHVNADGKRYTYEKGGVFYGGDYLPEPPSEIDLDTPPPPPEAPNPVI